MRLITLLFILLTACPVLADAPAETTEQAELPVSQRIELLDRALSGDMDALAAMDRDGEMCRWDWFYRGYALKASGRNDEAVRAWHSSVEQGHRLAVMALAAHHFEQREWLDAYSWARVAMEVDAALSDSDLNGLRGGWTLYAAVQSAERLDEEQHSQADALAAQRVNRHLANLISPSDVGTAAPGPDQHLDIVKRKAPVFPRAMWENGVPGWVYLQFEVKSDGRVGEVVPVGASNDRFARAAVRAIRKWRFNAEAMDRLPTLASQQIDFNLAR